MAKTSYPHDLPDLPCGHGALGSGGFGRADQARNWIGDHRQAEAKRQNESTGPVAKLNRPLRSEREVLEGRQAVDALNRLLGCRPLLAIDTLEVKPQEGRRSAGGSLSRSWDQMRRTPPGRLLVALNATGDLWLVAWQNAASGEVKDGLFHRSAGEAFEDLATRCRRAGPHVLRPEVGERLP